MQAKIDLITILADNAPAMKTFYRDVLGFTVKDDRGEYVEFDNDGVRLAICARSIMAGVTDHADFDQPRRGQTFELAFPCRSPAAVDEAYTAIVTKGATPIAPPASMPWGQRAAFFADPEGNIHELFAELDP